LLDYNKSNKPVKFRVDAPHSVYADLTKEKIPDNMVETDKLQLENARLQTRINELEASQRIALLLGQTLEISQVLDELAENVAEMTQFRQVVVFIMDDEAAALKFGAVNELPKADGALAMMKALQIRAYSASRDWFVSAWLRGQSMAAKPDPSPASLPAQRLAHILEADSLVTVPLVLSQRLVGLLLLDDTGLTDEVRRKDQRLLESIAGAIAIALENARLHSRTVEELASKMHELYVLRQIDRELNEMIEPDYVFELTMDWALRFTLAQAASLNLYNEDIDEMRIVAAYGYELPVDELSRIRLQQGGGIAYRVARSGHAELIPDVAMDKDYIPVPTVIHSQLCVPVMREDRVIAIITVESNQLNGFTEAHLEFIEKLAARAGVAIDNARLFGETEREREKLSRILSNTADVVIVVNADHRIELINQSAIAATRLYPDEKYEKRNFAEVFEDTDLLKIYRRAINTGQTTVGEVLMPEERIFYANVARYEGIGLIIVMHDITHIKETDRLKNELVATVSHDLKQPLSVMNGYSELLLMQPTFEPQSANYVKMIQRSINNMRQLIDDLLNLARIESGMQLDMQPLSLESILKDCIETVKPVADSKMMTVTTHMSGKLPRILGEKGSMGQIFNNLVGNAVKYTPPEGKVEITAERNGQNIRVAVKDTGLGISPEDQAHVFDRFYRVRRPETDSIEGTGLGLAIVRRLVEVHNGHLDLESHLGEGSTFSVTLPIYQE
jgi:signal transduction histidine kinase